MRPEVSLHAYRSLTRTATLLAIVLVSAGAYLLLHAQLAWGATLVGAGVLAVALSALPRIRAEPGGERLIVLVTKRDCTLCEEAKARLRDSAAARPFTVQEIRLEDFPDLGARYKDWVPVVLWQHEELAKGNIDYAALEARLSSIAARWSDASTTR